MVPYIPIYQAVSQDSFLRFWPGASGFKPTSEGKVKCQFERRDKHRWLSYLLREQVTSRLVILGTVPMGSIAPAAKKISD